jgi:hypothetical protein
MRALIVLALSCLFACPSFAQYATLPAGPPTPTTTQSAFAVHGYGIVNTNASYTFGGTNNLDLAQWATPATGNNFSFTARQSRFGLRALWTQPPSALHAVEIGGQIEADFFGGFFGQGSAYYFPIPRLRIARAWIAWKHVRFTVGQDWAIIAPLNPDSPLHLGVPGLTAAGNIWERMPQLRLDGSTGDRVRFVWALALVAEVQADGIATVDNAFTGIRKPEGGESALMPGGEARFAVAVDQWDKAIELGIGGHVGKRSIAWAGGTVDTYNYAVAIDLHLPLGRYFLFKGEGYWGQGLDSFTGGVQQGFSFYKDNLLPNSMSNANGVLTNVGPQIHVFGGWAQVSVMPIGWLAIVAAGGVDRPNTQDFLPATATTNARTFNAAAYGELNFELGRGFLLSLEYDFLYTTFQIGSAHESQVVALTGQLTF